MPAEAESKPVARVLLTLPEAAEACAVSLEHFRRCILPHLKVVRLRTSVRVSVKELERWVEENGAISALR